MKKLTKKIWIGILSGVALIFGGASCHFGDVEELYGPPVPEVNDTIDERATEPLVPEVEEPTILEENL